MRQFLSDPDTTVVDPFPKPALACHVDCLIDRFVEYIYRGSELQNLNNCLLHLHALHLSD
jgi:hypothetical protein